MQSILYYNTFQLNVNKNFPPYDFYAKDAECWRKMAVDMVLLCDIMTICAVKALFMYFYILNI